MSIVATLSPLLISWSPSDKIPRHKLIIMIMLTFLRTNFIKYHLCILKNNLSPISAKSHFDGIHQNLMQIKMSTLEHEGGFGASHLTVWVDYFSSLSNMQDIFKCLWGMEFFSSSASPLSFFFFEASNLHTLLSLLLSYF